jgi:hypothetical protein
MYQLKKSLYENIVNFFLSISFKHCETHHSFYVLHVNGETFIVALYVDDLVIIGSNVDMILGLKKQLTDTVEMIDLGLLHFFLGVQV